MKTKTRRDDRLDVRKIAEQPKEYEESAARGGLKITIPVDQAVKLMAKVSPELKSSKRKSTRR